MTGPLELVGDADAPSCEDGVCAVLGTTAAGTAAHDSTAHDAGA